MREGGIQNQLISGILCIFDVVKHALAARLQAFPLAAALGVLVVLQLCRRGFLASGLAEFLLVLHGLAFPTSSHAPIIGCIE